MLSTQIIFTTIKSKNLDKENFPPLIKKLFECGEAFTRLHAIDGFQYDGIFPRNKNNINQEKLKITQTFNPPIKAPIPSTPAITITSVTSSSPKTLYNQFQEALNEAKLKSTLKGFCQSKTKLMLKKRKKQT